MKIRPVGAKLLHADRQTDRQRDTTKLMDAFRNFEKAPKNVPWNSRSNTGVCAVVGCPDK